MLEQRRDEKTMGKTARRLATGCTLATVGLLTTTTVLALAATPAPPPPSAIGQESVFGIAVSPTFSRTGLALAMATPFHGCTNGQKQCEHLWATHDGGATWTLSPASGWQSGQPTISVDSRGHETVWAMSKSGLQRSDDEGDSWWYASTLPGGLAFPSPNYATDGTVVVAGSSAQKQSDYRVKYGKSPQHVVGSNGSLVDLSYAFSPRYPSGGQYAAALLSGADPKTSLPIIERCTADFTCSDPATLSGASPYPATLYPSSTYDQDGTVFAQSGRGVYKSIDGGGSFTQLAIVPANGAAATATTSMALAPHYQANGPSHTAYVSIFQVFTDPKNVHTVGGVYRSTDGGLTWNKAGAGSPLDGGSMAVAVSPSGRLFAGYITQSQVSAGSGLLCSPDGSSWTTSCSPVGSRANAVGDFHAPAGGGCSAQACPVTTAGGGAPAGASQAPGSNADGNGTGGAANGSGPGASNGTGTDLRSATTGAGTKTSSKLPLIFGAIAVLLLVIAVAESLRRRGGPAEDDAHPSADGGRS